MYRSRLRAAQQRRANTGRWPRVVSVIAMAGLLGGCAGSVDKAPVDSAPLRPFYEQTIAWSDCHEGMQCGRLKVPLDYAAPDGDTIEIAVVRRPASDPAHRVGSLLYNPGGPGASGVDPVALTSDVIFSKRLRERFDIIGFDPRGVAQSTAIRCLADAEKDAESQVDGTPDDPREVEALLASARRVAAACQANSPAGLLGHVSTREVAADMDILRMTVLGDQKLHYFGQSYGTYLGAVYAERFPGNVGRLALDGAADPREWPWAPGYSKTKSQSFQTALDSFVADCVTFADCPLGTDPARADDELVELVQGADRRPLTGDATRQVTESMVLTAMAVPLFFPAAWPALREGLTQARSGNGEILLKLHDGFAQRSPEGHYSTLGDVVTAVNCLDGPPERSVADVDAALPELRAISPLYGPVFARAATCAEWPIKAVSAPHEITAAGAPPILVVGTTRDPATPYKWAQGLAEQLDSGVLLTYDGDGHGAYLNDASHCVSDAVDAYLIEGALPAQGKAC